MVWKTKLMGACTIVAMTLIACSATTTSPPASSTRGAPTTDIPPVEGESPTRINSNASACTGASLSLAEVWRQESCTVPALCGDSSAQPQRQCTAKEVPKAQELGVDFAPQPLVAKFGEPPAVELILRNRTSHDLPLLFSDDKDADLVAYARIFTEEGKAANFVHQNGVVDDVPAAGCPPGNMWGDSITEKLVRVVLVASGTGRIPVSIKWKPRGGPKCEELSLPRGHYVLRLSSQSPVVGFPFPPMSAPLVIE